MEEVVLQTAKVTHGSLAYGKVSSLASIPKIKFSTQCSSEYVCHVKSYNIDVCIGIAGSAKKVPGFRVK